jgi:DNA-binding NarL/FixJ family response regulator
LTRNFEDALSEFSKRHGLTPREASIVSLVLRGYTNAVIARELKISPGTVRNHRHRLYYKLDVTTERELFYLFLRMLTGDEDAADGARAPVEPGSPEAR